MGPTRKKPIQGGVDLLASQQTILPTSRWIDIHHLPCIFYLLCSSSSRPNQTTLSVPPAPASHGKLRLRRPTVPSNVGQSLPLFPHTSCYSQAASAPTRTRTRTSNPCTPLSLRLDRRIFHGSCSFRPRPRHRPPPCGLGSLVVRGALPSCIVNIVNNREEQGDDCPWRG